MLQQTRVTAVIPYFERFAARFPGRGRARGRRARRGPRPVERARVLRPRSQPPRGGARGVRKPRRPLPGHVRGARCAARDRALDGGRDPRPRLRAALPDPRRQRQAGARPVSRGSGVAGRVAGGGPALVSRRAAHPAPAGRGLHPGDHGPRSDPVHPHPADVSPLPARGRMPGACAGRSDRVPGSAAEAGVPHPREAPGGDARRGRSGARRAASPERDLGWALELSGGFSRPRSRERGRRRVAAVRRLRLRPGRVRALAPVEHGFTHFRLRATPVVACVEPLPHRVADAESVRWIDPEVAAGGGGDGDGDGPGAAAPAQVGLAAAVGAVLSRLDEEERGSR